MSFRAMPVPVITAGHQADVTWPTGNKFLNSRSCRGGRRARPTTSR